MQPHLDAFVGVRTKKKHTMEIVNKMMSTLPKTVIKSETLKPKVDDESRPKIVSKVGYQAVRAQSAKATLSGSSPVMRRKGPVGFRNVFRDDESSVAIDEKSMSASMLESVNTMSDTDDDDYSTESDDEGSRPNSGPMCVRASVTGKFGRQRKAVSKSHSAQVMQELQSAIWETLQVPTVERIAVMGKYSSEMFARVFDESISLWTDVAILVACRIELKKVYVALQRGLLTIDSDHGDFFFRLIFDKIPKPFKLTYNPDVRYRKRTGPDAHVFSLFEEVKSFLLVEEDPLEMSRQDALVKLLDAAKRIDDRLIHSLDDAESRFFDTIPYGITSCKEWLANKAQKFPIPKT
ncbi:unnamed protein product [Symbiodinium microadriaticum]|nr:unnamed protein product [Symbiodinium microadriaticum]